MIRIERDTFYSRADLQALLEPCGVDADTFIGRLRPRKVFRALYKGSDILAAYDAAVPLAETHELPPPKNSGNRGRCKRAAVEALFPDRG